MRNFTDIISWNSCAIITTVAFTVIMVTVTSPSFDTWGSILLRRGSEPQHVA